MTRSLCCWPATPAPRSASIISNSPGVAVLLCELQATGARDAAAALADRAAYGASTDHPDDVASLEHEMRQMGAVEAADALAAQGHGRPLPRSHRRRAARID